MYELCALYSVSGTIFIVCKWSQFGIDPINPEITKCVHFFVSFPTAL